MNNITKKITEVYTYNGYDYYSKETLASYISYSHVLEKFGYYGQLTTSCQEDFLSLIDEYNFKFKEVVNELEGM